MPAEPAQPHERTLALGGHRIETAIALWRNGSQLVERQSEPRRQAYEHAVGTVLATLAAMVDIPSLIAGYYRMTPEREQALSRACTLDQDDAPLLNRGIAEDAAFYARYRQIVATSPHGGPRSQR